MGADHGMEDGGRSRGSGRPYGLVYHAGGLGDFVLSLPAVFRVAAAHPHLRWHFWGPRERLALLPEFRPAPGELLRAGHTLWGSAPDPAVADLSNDAFLPEPDIENVHNEVRAGCLLYFSIASAAFGLLVAYIYWRY